MSIRKTITGVRNKKERAEKKRFKEIRNGSRGIFIALKSRT